MHWDPERYLAYADERGRPFVELLARIDAERQLLADLPSSDRTRLASLLRTLMTPFS